MFTTAKTRVLATIIESKRPKIDSVERALVIGCGDGSEAGAIADFFGCNVDAIDIDDYYTENNPKVKFTRMDATALSFPNEYFDLVYSFHALEHITAPKRAIDEAHRVLKLGGMFCIGTPNKSRLIAYISSENTDLRHKILWNLKDWSQRLTGRFKNELGAHAGYTSRELIDLCTYIGPCISVTGQFYQAIYSRFSATIKVLQIFGIARFLFPCCYVVGWRSSRTEL